MQKTRQKYIKISKDDLRFLYIDGYKMETRGNPSSRISRSTLKKH